MSKNTPNSDYFQIDAKNTFIFSSQLTRKFQFHSSISVIGPGNEITITKKMNKLYSYFLPASSSFSKEKPKTCFDMSIELSKEYMKANKHCIIEPMAISMNTILNTNYKDQQFAFTNENIEDLSIVLFYSFWRIHTCSKDYFHIDSQADFNSAIFDINYQNIDALHLYINPFSKKNSEAKLATDRGNNYAYNSKENNDSMKCKRNNLNNETINPFASFNESTNSPRANAHDLFSDCFQYFHSEIEQYQLPIEIILLVNIFQTIKQLNFSIEVMTRDLINKSLIILFNSKWLFPNLIEISIDYVSNKISDYLNPFYSEILTTSLNEIDMSVKTTRYDSTDQPICSWEPLITKKIFTGGMEMGMGMGTTTTTDNEQTTSNTSIDKMQMPDIQRMKIENEGKCQAIISEIECKLDMAVIYSYFISQLEQLKVLTMRFYDPFTIEINQTLDNKQISLNANNDSSFINILLFNRAISQLTIEFNAIDDIHFEKVIALINNSTLLRRLRLSLFAPEDHYSPSRLYKLYCNIQSMPFTLFQEKSALAIANNINDDIDYIIIGKLINSFAKDLDCLLYSLQSLTHLNELYLNIDLPSIIAEDERYIMVLIKFLFNVFIYMFNEKHSFYSVKIISPLMPFDGRKCPLINQFLENIDASNSETKIERLTIQLKLYCVVNIKYILSVRLTWLFVGDLDIETFTALIDFYANEEFYKSSRLISLRLSLSNVLMNYSSIKNTMISLYKHTPDNLTELFLYSNIKIPYDDMRSIFFVINYNTVRKYFFSLNQGSHIEIDKYKKSTLFYMNSKSKLKLRVIYFKLNRIGIKRKNDIKPILQVFRDYIAELKEIEYDLKSNNK